MAKKKETEKILLDPIKQTEYDKFYETLDRNKMPVEILIDFSKVTNLIKIREILPHDKLKSSHYISDQSIEEMIVYLKLFQWLVTPMIPDEKRATEILKSKIKKLHKDYRKIFSYLFVLLAWRNNEFNTYINNEVRELDFEVLEDIYVIFENSNLVSLFLNQSNISIDIFSFVYGIEAGMDTNTRKNRVGTWFEEEVETYLNKELSPNRYNFEKQLNFKHYTGEILDWDKKFDFIINDIEDSNKKIFVEVNKYTSDSGSKPSEILRSYIQLNNDLNTYNKQKSTNYSFVWLTDGPIWEKMLEPIKNGFNNIDYFFNYKMFQEYIKALS